MSIGGLDFDDFFYLDSELLVDAKYKLNQRTFIVAGVSYNQGFYYTGSEENDINSGEKSSYLQYAITGQHKLNSVLIEGFINYKNHHHGGGFIDSGSQKGYSEISSLTKKSQSYGLSLALPF